MVMVVMAVRGWGERRAGGGGVAVVTVVIGDGRDGRDGRGELLKARIRHAGPQSTDQHALPVGAGEVMERHATLCAWGWHGGTKHDWGTKHACMGPNNP